MQLILIILCNFINIQVIANNTFSNKFNIFIKNIESLNSKNIQFWTPFSLILHSEI